MLSRKLTQLLLQRFVLLFSSLIPITAPLHCQQPASPALAHFPLLDRERHIPATAYELHPFFSITPFSTSRSSVRSATMCFRRRAGSPLPNAAAGERHPSSTRHTSYSSRRSCVCSPRSLDRCPRLCAALHLLQRADNLLFRELLLFHSVLSKTFRSYLVLAEFLGCRSQATCVTKNQGRSLVGNSNPISRCAALARLGHSAPPDAHLSSSWPAGGHAPHAAPSAA